VILAGKMINSRVIKVVPFVERGEIVTVLVPLKGGFISASGIAREDGDLGDIVSIENSNSHKIIKGKIIKSGVVEVCRGGKV
jgi:flagella basal body P-ring formation protein FlgA